MFFVPIAKPLDDQHRFIDAWRLDVNRLEPSLEGSIFLNMLSIFIESCGADTLDFAPRQCGLEHVGGIDRSFRRPCSHQGMEFIDEDDDVSGLDDFLHHDLQPFLELAAIFCPCNQ